MPYLVDGHNLIPKVPGLSLTSIDDEMHLIEWLQIFCQRQQKIVEVFFDQAPPGFKANRSFGRVTAHFVRQGTTADAAIHNRLLALGKEARNYIVVSSDRQVQAFGRAAHAQVQSSEVFAREMMLPGGGGRPEPGRERTLSSEEVTEWENLFKQRKKGA